MKRITFLLSLLFFACNSTEKIASNQAAFSILPFIEVADLIQQTDIYLAQNPITITAFPAPNSDGRLHDYYSEGRYWWPNPNNPNGPYIRKDGYSNPNNFNQHKKALGLRYCQIIPRKCLRA